MSEIEFDETKPIVVRESITPIVSTNYSLSPLVQAAMDKKLDTEKLNELLVIQEKFEIMESKKAYHKAVAEYKKDAPTIKKDRIVSYKTDKGTTTYNHVGLGYALSEINPSLAKHGLSLSWKTNQENGQVIVTAYLTHWLGHSEQTTLGASPDSSGGKNGIQSIASSTTYLKRHTAFALLGLEGVDDDDGNAGGGNVIEYITEDQAADLEDLIEEVGANRRAFVNGVLKIQSGDLLDLPAAKLNGAIKLLEQKRRQQGDSNDY